MKINMFFSSLIIVIFFSAATSVRAGDPMVIKLQPIIFGDLYPDDDELYKTIMEGPGYIFSLDSGVELKVTKVTYHRSQSDLKDVSTAEINQLLYGGVLDSQLDAWSSDDVPVIFVDSVNEGSADVSFSFIIICHPDDQSCPVR